MERKKNNSSKPTNSVSPSSLHYWLVGFFSYTKPDNWHPMSPVRLYEASKSFMIINL